MMGMLAVMSLTRNTKKLFCSIHQAINTFWFGSSCTEESNGARDYKSRHQYLMFLPRPDLGKKMLLVQIAVCIWALWLKTLSQIQWAVYWPQSLGRTTFWVSRQFTKQWQWANIPNLVLPLRTTSFNDVLLPMWCSSQMKGALNINSKSFYNMC